MAALEAEFVRGAAHLASKHLPSRNRSPKRVAQGMYVNSNPISAIASRSRRGGVALVLALMQAVALWLYAPATQAQSATASSTDAAAVPAIVGPMRLRQPVQSEAGLSSGAPASDAQPASGLNEFESYVQGLPGGTGVRRFGTTLLAGMYGDADASYNPLVPPDYLLRVGDELVVTLWGSVDADLRLMVDRSGRITIPRVGPVMVSGVRYADLPDVISRRVGQTFKNFQLSVTLGQLRGMRVYVTGFVNKPGAVMVNSLSTLAQALLRAGAPSAAGSYRQIQLKRGRAVVTTFDLYELLLRGDRNTDVLLQPEDVIHVGPIGDQVAIIGSVNRPVIVELKRGESLDDLLRAAGGFTAVADTLRLTLERLDDRNELRVVELRLPDNRNAALRNGDVLRAYSAVTLALPQQRQNKRISVEGEVVRPGEYLLPPTSSIADALRMAGGFTTSAYLYAAEFSRESVRAVQQRNYERALRDMETQLVTNAATRRVMTVEEAGSLGAINAATAKMFEQLRALKPNGRIVLQLQPNSTELPDLPLEDGDRLYIPPRSTTVGVFGSVFSAGSYLYSPQRTVNDYLRLAGGPTRGADDNSVFVIRANGTVASSRQESGWFSRGNQIASAPAEPGDTIFVPEEMNKSNWVQATKDWTQILYQFGIGAAAMKSAFK